MSTPDRAPPPEVIAIEMAKDRELRREERKALTAIPAADLSDAPQRASFLPQSMGEAMQLATIMARSTFVPGHCRGNEGKGLGRNQSVILDRLSRCEWITSNELANFIGGSAETARSAVRGLKRRGFNIEWRTGQALLRSYRLRPFVDQDWLPVAFIPDFWRMTQVQDFTVVEARRIIEDHIAVLERRSARQAA